MTPLDAAALFALLLLPFHWLVQRHFAQMEDPAYLRRQGIVIVQPGVIESRSEAIGRYRGHDICRVLTFKGTQYRFDRIMPAQERERLGPGELYLEPGLVYVAV